jgi:hypothetical protein
MSSFTFLIGAVVVTVIANVALLRYFLTQPNDLTFEE